MPLLDFATIPIWLQILAYVYLVGGILTAIYIAYDILKKRHMQKIPIMNVVWPVTVFYLFPLGLWLIGIWVIHIHVHQAVINNTL